MDPGYADKRRLSISIQICFLCSIHPNIAILQTGTSSYRLTNLNGLFQQEPYFNIKHRCDNMFRESLRVGMSEKFENSKKGPV